MQADSKATKRAHRQITNSTRWMLWNKPPLVLLMIVVNVAAPGGTDGYDRSDSVWRVRRLSRDRSADRDCVRHIGRDARAAGAGDDWSAHPAAAGRSRAVAAGHLALARKRAFLMRRSQRSAHRLLWPVLALAIGIGVTLALVWRPPPPVSEPPSEVVR